MKPSITFADAVVLPMSRDQAWQLLKDPHVVVTCLPGAEVLDVGADGTVQGALTLSLGPSATRFVGRVTPVYDDEAYTVEMAGQGADGKGRTRASITTAVRVDDLAERECRLSIDSSISVSGALAAFAAAGGQPIAKRMLLDFSENLGRLGASVALADAAGDEPVDVAAFAAASSANSRLSVVGLLWRTLRDAVVRTWRRLTRRSNTTA